MQLITFSKLFLRYFIFLCLLICSPHLFTNSSKQFYSFNCFVSLFCTDSNVLILTYLNPVQPHSCVVLIVILVYSDFQQWVCKLPFMNCKFHSTSRVRFSTNDKYFCWGVVGNVVLWLYMDGSYFVWQLLGITHLQFMRGG